MESCYSGKQSWRWSSWMMNQFCVDNLGYMVSWKNLAQLDIEVVKQAFWPFGLWHITWSAAIIRSTCRFPCRGEYPRPISTNVNYHGHTDSHCKMFYRFRLRLSVSKRLMRKDDQWMNHGRWNGVVELRWVRTLRGWPPGGEERS